MPLSPGDKLGPYEILAPIGAGGMGDVYKANDTRLDRVVAIKVSKTEFNERFEREARAVAALNHSNICQLYDVGPNYLVMEFIEGTPLKGPLPVDQALRYAAQICHALDAAHKKGITHRDLKPANILVTKTGIKLLDFGLAKIAAPTSGVKPGDATLTMVLTGKNEIVGTLYYMSPEQLQEQAGGQQIDSRSDIFSFGLVLYEMLTGKRAFNGASPASVIAAIMERPAPSIAEVAPAALDRALQRCLKKDPDDRWQTARDLKAELEWIATPSGASASAASPSGTVTVEPASQRSRWIAPIASAALALIAASVAFVHFREVKEEPQLMKLSVLPPEEGSFASTGTPALSPDGRHLAFLATLNGKTSIWVRDLDSLVSRPLPGTESGSYPFWSPDGRSIAFFTPGQLKKIELAGGPSLTLCDVPDIGRGGSWSPSGVIVFSANLLGLYSVSASGGKAAPLALKNLPTGGGYYRLPWFLPDGHHFLYVRTVQRQLQQDGVYVADVDSKEDQFLLPANSMAIYAAPGYLLFARENTLMAQPFDAGTLKLKGEAVPVADQVYRETGISGQYGFTASQNGILVFLAGGGTVEYKLTWFDRQGKMLGTVGDPGGYQDLSISPDGTRAAVHNSDGLNDIWLFDFARGAKTRFTFGPGPDQEAVWSRDGSQIVFVSQPKGPRDIYRKSSTGASEPQLLLATDQNKYPNDWSPDGRFLLYTTLFQNNHQDLMLLPLKSDGSVDGPPSPFLATPFNESHGRFSPDGHWVVYTSDESGSSEVYVRPFPRSSGGTWQISAGGGFQPLWRRDGKEVLYFSPDSKLMSVEVSTGGTFKAASPKELFLAPISAGPGGSSTHRWDISPDGQRFLINVPPDLGESAPMSVVINWQAGLKK